MDDSIFHSEMISEFSQASLLEIIKYQEDEYIKINKNNAEWNHKYYRLKQLKMDIFSKKVISQEDFSILRSFAKTKGGFLTNEIRKDLWKKILCIDNLNEDKRKYELLYINESYLKDNNSDGLFIKKEESFDLKIENEFHNIIEVDVKRSKINLLFSKEGGFHDTNVGLKKNLNKFVNTLTTLNNQNYSYYQGYHDIALHFLILYMNDFHTGVSVFQRFSEFFLKENLMKPEQNFNKGYNFERVISILADIIKLISPETMTYIEEYCYGRPSFAISWILTLFTHNVLDSSVQFRLFDYFITSHPVTIFYLCAVIVIEETLKLAKNSKYLVRKIFFLFLG